MNCLLKEKKMLKWTILMIALFQMPALAVSPSISGIMENFPGHSLKTVQTLLQLPNLISPFVALFTAFVSRLLKERSSKKRDIVAGLSLLFLTALGVAFVHTAFWNLYIWGAVLGISLGLFLPSTTGMMVALFNEKERRVLTGQQTAFINGGGIMMSILGGLMATTVWYGGYLVFFLSLPVILLCLKYLPDRNKMRTVARYEQYPQKTGYFNINILYYAAIIFLFMMTYSVSMSNMSVYIQDELRIGDSATTGIISAFGMGGGTVCGLFFGKISSKFKDFILPFAFFILFVGFLINAFAHSLTILIIGSVLLGSTISMVMSQCVFSISLYVNERSSGLATSIAMSVAPSLGGFVSPSIYTTVTMLIKDTISFRYLFTGLVSLGLSVILLLLTLLRKKRGLTS
jgi:MFS family permease